MSGVDLWNQTSSYCNSVLRMLHHQSFAKLCRAMVFKCLVSSADHLHSDNMPHNSASVDRPHVVVSFLKWLLPDVLRIQFHFGSIGRWEQQFTRPPAQVARPSPRYARVFWALGSCHDALLGDSLGKMSWMPKNAQQLTSNNNSCTAFSAEGYNLVIGHRCRHVLSCLPCTKT